MDNTGNDNPTAVTRLSRGSQKSTNHPIMSFTSVTTHQAMADAFVKEVLRIAQNIIPDKELNIEDLITIFQRALYDDKERSITMVSGRHLRSRISEQLSRARRYNEPFSLVVLNLNSITDREDYDAVVDTLRERMRQADLIFLFKYRIVLLLPHTEKDACLLMEDRIRSLLQASIAGRPPLETTHITFPSPEMKSGMDVLDWAENQLRT
jgi:hypothetical protein